MRVLHVFTGRVSDHRHWRGIDTLFLDTTLMSGDPVFAPTGNILWPYKRGEINEDQYTQGFYRVIKQRIEEDYKPWHWLINQESVCLACYCAHGKFCHRHLLKRPIEYLCRKEGIKYIDEGEPLW